MCLNHKDLEFLALSPDLGRKVSLASGAFFVPTTSHYFKKMFENRFSGIMRWLLGTKDLALFLEKASLTRYVRFWKSGEATPRFSK